MPETRNAVALTRAAQQERQRLEAHRERLVERARAIEDERDTLRDELVKVDERIRLLDALLDDPASDDPDRPGVLPRRVLRAAELREQAARILAARAGAGAAVDYNELFEWLQEAGFVVLGKRPRATFLTAISRSPVIRRAAQPGTYMLDGAAAERIARELGELQAEVRDLNDVIAREPSKRSELVRHRTAMLASTRRLKRQLIEAESVLATPRSISAARRDRGVA